MALDAATISSIVEGVTGARERRNTREMLEDVATAIQGTAVADMAGTEDLATTQDKINELLAALRDAGLIAAS
jgi:hypothetical protein